MKPATDSLLYKILNAGTMDKNEIEYQQDLDKNSIDTVFASGQTDLKSNRIFMLTIWSMHLNQQKKF